MSIVRRNYQASLASSLFGLLLLLLAPAAPAATGIEWLAAHSNPDGSYALDNDVSDRIQSTSETIQTLNALGETAQPGYSTALQYINAQSHHTTELLTRKIVANKLAGNDPSALVAELRAMKNEDGGFGDLAGYESTVLDTSFALLAFSQAGGASNTEISEALGFIMSQQNADGSFRIGYRDSNSIYVTSMALSAMQHFVLYFNLSVNIETAKSFLLMKHGASSGSGSDWQTALVLTAIVPVISDATQYANMATLLRTSQLADGSWSGDVYATALALRALWLVDHKKLPPLPENGNISGRVVDATTGQPVGNVSVTFTNTTVLQTTTGESGEYSLTNMAAGSYAVSYQGSGYVTQTQTISLGAGQVLDLGVVSLVPLSESGIVTGRITDAVTGAVISGASIAIYGSTSVIATTDATGAYKLIVTPGAISISVQMNGYDTVTAFGTVTGGSVFTFSPALFVAGTTPTSPTVTLRGRILDGDSASPIAGATVAIVGANVSVLSDASGAFTHADLVGSEYKIDVTKNGYQTAHITVWATGGGIIDLGNIVLSSIGSTTTVFGHVVDAESGQAISGATIAISLGGGSMATADGSYQVDGILGTQFQVTTSAVGYLSAVASVTLTQPGIANIEFKLPRAGATDFSIDSVTSEKLSYPALTEVELSVALKNTGTSSRGVRLYLVAIDSNNVVVDQRPAVIVPLGADPSVAIVSVAAGEQLAKPVDWNTARYTPGLYQIRVQAFDGTSGQLLSERATNVTIAPSQTIGGLAEFDPPIAQSASKTPVRLMAKLTNRGNQPIPAGTVTATVAFSNKGYTQSRNLYSIDNVAQDNGLNRPRGIHVETTGNVLVANCAGNSLLRVTPSGDVTTAMSGLACPIDVDVDSSGNIFVLNTAQTIVKLAVDGVRTQIATSKNEHRAVKVLADGRIMFSDASGLFEISTAGTVRTISAEGLAQPHGVAVDNAGNAYIANRNNNKISLYSNGVLSTYVSGLNQPTGLTFDDSGNLYVVTFGDNKLSRVAPDRSVTTIATGLSGPYDVKRFPNGDFLVSNYNSSEIVRITPAGIKTVIASAAIYSPTSATYGSNGSLYVLSSGSRNISELVSDGTVRTVGVTNLSPTLMTMGADNNLYYIHGATNLSRMTQQGSSSLIASNLRPAYGLANAPDGTGIVLSQYNTNEIIKVGFNGAVSSLVPDQIGTLRMMKRDAAGNIYLLSQSGFVTKVDLQGRVTRVVSGLNQPYGLAIDNNGSLIISEYGTQRLLRVDASGLSSVIASLAFKPGAVAVDSSGAIYTAPYSSATVYKVDSSGVVSTFAQLNYPVDFDIAIDIDNTLWATHSNYQRVTKLLPSGAQTQFTLNSSPAGLHLDGGGGVYVSGAGWVRQISATGTVTEIISQSVLGSSQYTGVVVDSSGRLWVSRNGGLIYRFASNRTLDMVFGAITGPYGITYVGTDLIVANRGAGNVLRIHSADSLPEVVGSGLYERIAHFGSDKVVLTTFGNIKTMNLNTGAVSAFAVTGSQSSETADLVETPDGRVLVVDQQNNELTYFNISGQVVDRNIGAINPKGVAIDSTGSVLVAASFPAKIIRIDTSGARSTFARANSNYLEFAQDGSLLATTSDRIYRITTTGTTTFTYVGFELGGIAQTTSGGYFITSPAKGSLHLFKTDMTHNAVASGLSRIEDIATDSTGRVFVADYNAGVISRVYDDGRTAVFADNLPLAKAMNIDSADTLYIVYNYSNIASITSTGERKLFPVERLLASRYPTGISIDAQGIIYGSLDSQNTLFRFSVNQDPITYNVGDVVHVVTRSVPELAANDAQMDVDFGTWIPPASGDYTLAVTSSGTQVDGVLNNTLHVGATANGVLVTPLQTALPGNRAITATLNVSGADSTSITRIHGEATSLTSVSGVTAPRGWGIGSDSNGNIFFAAANRIVKVAPNQSSSDFVTGLPFDYRMVMDLADNIYISNSGSKTIERITPAGVRSPYKTFTSVVHAIAVGFDDLLYAITATDGLVRIQDDGVIEPISKFGFNSPFSMTIDSFGNIYVLDNNNYITRITASGQVSVYLDNGAGFEKEGVNLTADCSNNILFAPTIFPLKTTSFEEDTIYQIVGDTGEIRQVLYGPTIHPDMWDMDVFTYDKRSHRVLIWTDLNNGKIFSMPVTCGSISAEAHIVARADVNLMSANPAASQVIDLGNGMKEYVWSLTDVDAQGKNVQLNLLLQNLAENEQRPIVSEAYIQYSNSFVPGQYVRVPMDVPVVHATTAVQVTPMLDAAAYGPNSPVSIAVNVINDNEEAFSGSLALAVLDTNGALVATLSAMPIDALVSHGAVTINNLWNTAATYAGNYKLVAEIRNTSGAVVRMAEVPFAVQTQAPGGTATLYDVSIYSDRQSYQAWDVVNLAARIRNLATNALLNASVLSATVKAPDGSTVYASSATTSTLVSGAIYDAFFSFALADSKAGTYTIVLTATDQNSGAAIANAASTFAVQRREVQSLSGAVAAGQRSVYVGDSNQCTDTVINNSSTAVSGVTLTYLLMNMETGTPVSQTTVSVDLPAGGTINNVRAIDTHGFSLGGYSCILQATIAGETKTLAFGSFSILKQPNDPPLAKAGLDVTTYVGQGVVLNGTGSSDPNSDPLTYSWTLSTRPLGSAAELIDATTATPALIPDKRGVYEATLTVNDGKVNSAPDIVRIDVLNSAPVAVAGVAQAGYIGDTITMDGIGSTDVDGDTLTYHWSISSAPTGSTAALTSTTTQQTSLVLDKHGSYTVQLIVNDDSVNSEPSTLVITVKNHIPVAEAGADVAAEVGQTVTLNGSTSRDADNDALAYRWSFVSVPTGSRATLSNSASAQPLFVPDLPGVYMASLVVSDGIADSAADFVTVTVVSPKPIITTEFRNSGRHRVLVLMGKNEATSDAEEVEHDDACVRTTGLDLDTAFTPALNTTAQVLVELYGEGNSLLDSERVTLATFNTLANSAIGANVDMAVQSFDANHLTLLLRGVNSDHAMSNDLTLVATVWNDGNVQRLSSGTLALDCTHQLASNTDVGAFHVLKSLTSANDADALAPTYDQQRAFLEALLKRESWSSHIVETASDFTRELRTGNYGMYLVLSGGDKLDETVQKELREAVYHGDGLLVANGHDNRNHGLASALGIQFKGDDPKATGIHLQPSDLGIGGDANFAFDDNVLRIELKGATAAGNYTYTATPEHSDSGDHDDEGHDDPKSTAAVTTFDYGQGHAVHIGFDALGNATATGDDSVFANLIADALVYINPAMLTNAGDVIELELTLTDKKIATTGQVELTLPAGFTVIDAGAANPQTNGTLVWTFDLAEGASAQLHLALRLPNTAGAQTLAGIVKIRIDGVLEDYGTVTLNLQVTAVPTLRNAIDLATTLSKTKSPVNYAEVLKTLKQADTAVTAGQFATALKELLKATDKLLNAGSVDAGRLRLMIDQAIRAIERKL